MFWAPLTNNLQRIILSILKAMRLQKKIQFAARLGSGAACLASYFKSSSQLTGILSEKMHHLYGAF
jgi:hypothetical protein